jgi:hypothetical protein
MTSETHDAAVIDAMEMKRIRVRKMVSVRTMLIVLWAELMEMWLKEDNSSNACTIHKTMVELDKLGDMVVRQMDIITNDLAQ